MPADIIAVTKAFTVILLCCTYIAVSSLLIRFNKYLIAPERFPYPMALSTMHMGCSLVLCSLFYLVRPTAFPSMASTEGKRLDLFRRFLPLGIAYAISLFASNQAYVYANVTFLQFMKEGNVVISFLISCAVGLQVMDRIRVTNILWIMAFSVVCVGGDMQFVWMGLIVQLISQVAECSRLVMGECLLSGMKLDPLTYTMFAAPACLVGLLVGNLFVWDPEILPRIKLMWQVLLPNASLAFLLNVIVATMIKETSAVGYILAGVVKDIVLVVISAMFFGEQVTHQQAGCFVLILMGILFWSFSKSMPDHPFVCWVEAAMGLPRKETLPLITKHADEPGVKIVKAPQ